MIYALLALALASLALAEPPAPAPAAAALAGVEAPLAIWSAPLGEVRRDRAALAQLVALPEGTTEVAWVLRALPRAGGYLPATEANALFAWVGFEGRRLPSDWGRPEDPVAGRAILEGALAAQVLPAELLAGAEDQGTRVGLAVDAVYTAGPALLPGVEVEHAWHVAGEGFVLSLLGLPPEPAGEPEANGD